MVLIHRRSILGVLGLTILGSGCAARSERGENQSTVVGVSSVETTEIDGTKSALGYVTFIENPAANIVTVEQSLRVPGNPGETIEMNVTPDSGPTAGEPVKVAVSVDSGSPQAAAPSVLPGDYPNPSAVEIEFESLSAEQMIRVVFVDSDVTAEYTTTGEKTTTTREPIEVPDGVRVD